MSSTGAPSTRDMVILERFQWRVIKTTKRLKHLPYKDRLIELVLFSLEKVHSIYINTLRVKRRWSQALSSGTQCYDKGQYAQTGTQGVPFEHQETILYAVIDGTGTVTPRVCGVTPLGDLPKPPGHGPQKWLWTFQLERWIWTRWPPEVSLNLNRSVILCFCVSINRSSGRNNKTLWTHQFLRKS